MKKIAYLLFVGILGLVSAGALHAQSQEASTNKNVKASTVDTYLNIDISEFVGKPIIEDDYVVLEQFHYNRDEEADMPVSVLEGVIQTAMSKIGTRYRAGGTTNEGFDCSGLVFSSFKHFDITLPRSSFDMANKIERIQDDKVRRGDLIFFTTNGKKRINHVGIVTEVKPDEILFVHSSTQLGVITSSTKEPYYKRTYARVGRVM